MVCPMVMEIYKVYEENEFPPSGQTDQHYRGEFKFGLKDGEGEIFDETGKSLEKIIKMIKKSVRKLTS